MADEPVVTSIEVDARPGEAALQDYQASLEQVGAATDQLIAKQDQASTSFTSTGQTVTLTARQIAAATKAATDYAARLDPAALASAKLSQEQSRIQQAMLGTEQLLKTGQANLDGYSTSAAQLVSRLNEVTTAQAQLAAGLITASQAVRSLSTEAERSGAISDVQAASIRGVSKATSDAATVAQAYGASVSGIISIQDRLTNSLAGTSEAVKLAYAASVAPIDTTTEAVKRNYNASVQLAAALNEEASERIGVKDAYQASIQPYTAVTDAVKANYDASISLTRAMQEELATRLQAKAAYEASTAPYSSLADTTARNYNASLEAAKAYNQEMTAKIGVTEAYQASIAPYAGVVKSEQQVAQAAKDTAASLAEQARQIDALDQQAKALRDRIDPAGASILKFNEGVSNLDALLQAGKITSGEYSTGFNLLGKQFLSGNDQAKGAAAGVGVLTGALKLNRQGASELQAAFVNAGQAIASGISVARVAEMEGAQVLGAFIQGGVSLKSILGALLSPTGLLTAGIIALGLALTVVLVRAATNESQLRSFNVALLGAGTSSEATAKNLQVVARALRDTGTAADDANKLVLTFARNPALNPGSIGNLAPLARNISAFNGDDASRVADEMAKAFTTSTEATINFVYSIAGPNGLTVAEAANMRQMDEHGNRAGALGVAILALQRRFDGLHDQSLSPFQKAIDDLAAAWNRFLNRLADTAVIKALQDALQGVVNLMTQFLNGSSQAANTISKWSSVLGAIIPGAGVVGGVAALTQQMTSEKAGPPAPSTLVQAGPSNSFDTRALDTNSADLQRLTTVLDAAVKHLPEGYGLIATSTTGGQHTDGSLHYQSRAMDVQLVGPNGAIPNRGADTTGLYTQLAGYAYLENQRLFPNTPIAWGGSFGVKPGSTVPDLMHFDTGPQRGNLAPPLSDIAAGLQNTPVGGAIQLPTMNVQGKSPVSNAVSSQDLQDLQKAQEQFQRLNDAASQFGLSGVAAEAYWQKFYSSSKTGEAKILEASQAANDAVTQRVTQLQKEATVQDVTNQGTAAAGKLYGDDEVAGIKATAQAQAHIAAITQGANEQQKFNELLQTGAAEALNAAGKAIPALKLQTTENQNLYAAAQQGTAAEHEAELQNQATTATHEVLQKAIASGNQTYIAEAKVIADKTLEQIKANDAAKQAAELQHQINANTDQISVLNLQVSLQGQTTEQINAQVQLLQAKQDLERRGVKPTEDIYQNYLKSVDALGQANIKLAEAQRNQERINDAFRNIGDTINSTLTQAIEDAFNGKRVTDFGSLIKSTLGSVVAQITSGLFIKPLIGTALSAIGLTQAATQYGTLNSVLGIGGAAAGAAGPVSGVGGATSSSSGLLGNLLQGGGLLKDIFGLSSSSSGSSAGSFLSNLLPDSFSDAFSGGLGGIFSHVPTAADFAAGVGPVLEAPGSLFGSFGGFAGGLGAGFGAGSLLNTLVGGNSTFGTIGSGIGALAGSFLGPLGSIGGGAIGGLLGGLFGNNKPPDLASGGVIDLGTGKIFNAQSGGNSQNDQTASAIGTALSNAVTRALAIPGATLPGGAVSVQAGSRDGIKLSYGGQEYHFADAQSAINAGLIQIRDHLGGVSDTVHKVLGAISDPSQIDDALQFAATYDKISDAAASAFSQVEASTQSAGPFETAMQQISAEFDQIKTQATQFGLSLDPVNAALDEATKRLRDDFSKSIDTAFNSATGNDFLNNIQNIIDSYSQMTRDASAIGADTATHDRLGQLVDTQLSSALSGLSVSQLQSVISSFGQLGITDLPALAKSALDAAQAVASLNNEMDRQNFAYQAQQDFDNAIGQGFLAQLRDLDKTAQSQLTQAGSLGFGDNSYQQAIIKETEHKSALSILQGLNNDQLEVARQTLEALNPAFGAWVDEAKAAIQTSTDAAAATQAQADAQQRSNDILQAGLQIRQYLNSLETGTDFTSPQSRLQAAQSQYGTQLGMAQGGDVTALQGITQTAQTLLDAVKAFYATSAAGQNIVAQVKADLAALPGVPDPTTQQTNAIVTATNAVQNAVTDGTTQVTGVTTVGDQSIVSTAISTSASIVAASQTSSEDIVSGATQNSASITAATITSSNSIVSASIDAAAAISGTTAQGTDKLVSATLTGADSVVASSVETAAAVTTTAAAVTTGTAATIAVTEATASDLIASNASNASTLFDGNKQDAAALMTNNSTNSAALQAAGQAQASALLTGNAQNASALAGATLDGAAQIISGNNQAASGIIANATAATAQYLAASDSNTSSLIGANNQAAQGIISTASATAATSLQNQAQNTAALIGANNQSAAGLISTTNSSTAQTLDASARNTAALIGANSQATAVIVATASSTTASYLQGADQNTAAIISTISANDNAVVQATLVAGNSVVTAVGGLAGGLLTSGSSSSNAIVQAVFSAGNSNVSAVGAAAGGIMSVIAANDAGLVQAIFTSGSNTIGAVGGAADAVINTIASETNAIVGAQFTTGNGVVNIVGSAGAGIINSNFAAADSIVGAVFAGTGNVVGATFANGSSLVAAIFAASNSVIAATFASSNSLVAATVAANSNYQLSANAGQIAGAITGTTGAVYQSSSDITFGINSMSDRIAGLLGTIGQRLDTLVAQLNGLAELIQDNFQQMHDELAAINNTTGKVASTVRNAA